jgi:protein-S-isoprenylcysteine O-methyltransferase Ste14
MRVLELKVPPPVVFSVTALLMWMVSRMTPALAFQIPLRNAVAISLAVAGFLAAISGVVTFWRAKTTVNPLKPHATSSLVSWGIYRITRNPMYLGLLLVLAGWAILLSSPAALLFLPGFILYMNLFQIGPEERALTSLFGKEFQAYKSRSRRWL